LNGAPYPAGRHSETGHSAAHNHSLASDPSCEVAMGAARVQGKDHHHGYNWNLHHHGRRLHRHDTLIFTSRRVSSGSMRPPKRVRTSFTAGGGRRSVPAEALACRGPCVDYGLVNATAWTTSIAPHLTLPRQNRHGCRLRLNLRSC